MTTSKPESEASIENKSPKMTSNENLPKKIIIRRLPPSMTKEQFIDVVSPLPDYDHLYFCSADMRLGVNAFCRAYIYFKNYDDIFVFRDRFDNYIFLDTKSNEYPAVVEFSPYQRRLKFIDSQKKDPKCNTITEDSDYMKFLENFGKPSGEALPSCEAILEELEQRDNEKKLKEEGKIMTPLLEFMKRKREDKKMMMKEREREAKKRRDEERRSNNNSGRDKRRDRDHYKDSKNNDKSLSQPQNIKIMSKPKSEQTSKSSSSSQVSKGNDSNQKNESKQPMSKSSSYSYRDNRDRDRDRDNKSKNSGGAGKGGGYGGKSYKNHTETENKSKSQNDKAFEKSDKSYERSEKYHDKPEKMSYKSQRGGDKNEKSIENSGEASNSSKKERETTRDGKPKRPSIQIYNPAQRAAMREQKKEQTPPA